MIHRLAGVFAVLGIVVGGCGDSGGSTATLEGVVSIDGAPVEQGMISFTPMQVGVAVTADIREGRYKASGVPLGRVLVQLHARTETGRMLTDEADGGRPYPETIDLVPEKHRTGLEIMVAESTGAQDFELTSR